MIKGKYHNPILINADDFGRSEDINRAVLDLLISGRIQRTTLMVNMPFAKEAYQLTRDCNLLDRVGLHINLTDGKPLSQPILSTRFCKDGELDVDEVESGVRLHVSKQEREAIRCEVQAQFDKFKELFGYYPKHVDSHRHVHNYFGFLPTIVKIAKNCGVESMRIGINLYDHNEAGLAKKLYKFVLNTYIKSHFQHTDYMGAYLEYIDYYHYGKDKTVEIMVHPTYHEENIVDIIYSDGRKDFYDFDKIK